MTDNQAEWAVNKEAGSAWQLRFMRFLGLKAPRIVSSPLLWVIALVFAADRRRETTRASEMYLSRILNRPPTFWERHRHNLTFSHVFFERVGLLAQGTSEYSVSLRGGEIVQARVSKGRGCVLLGAHYGSFEALRALERDLPGLSVRYLMFPEHAEHSTRLLEALNPKLADRVISLANGPMAMFQVYSALDNGEFVAFLGDRVPDKSTRAAVTVEFLGGEISVPTSPYLTAMAAEVPIYLSFATWNGACSYQAEFTELYDGAHVARSERTNYAQKLAKKYAAVLESHCRRDPFNWFNFFDIWRD